MDQDTFIPQANPLAQYCAHRDEINEAVLRVLNSGRYILGPETNAFESEFAAFIGVDHAIGVSSGTAAIVLALQACGIGPRDEVITTPHTAVATVAAIEIAGATPVLADTEPDTFLLDPARVLEKVTAKTKAIIPVHLFGMPASLDQFKNICSDHKLFLIEDCAQAHGAAFTGKQVGSWGHIGCFSFYPTKNLGAIGDGGCVVTNDQHLAARLRELREYGWRSRFVSEAPGRNSRLDEMQAAILRVKLRYLPLDNKRRQHIAAVYDEQLTGQIRKPHNRPDRSNVFHQFVVRVRDREHIQRLLHQRGIGTAIHYPVPIHLQPAYYGRLGNVGSHPCAEGAASEILSLPIYPELPTAQIERIVSMVNSSCITSSAAFA